MAIYIDFEYQDSKEPNLGLVCCALQKNSEPLKTYWLYGVGSDKSKEELRDYLLENKDQNFICYASTAEARCFLTLGINPTRVKFVDLYLEYRCLSNHSNELAYGKQLIKGQVKFTKPKNRWEESSDSAKMEYGLAACCFKLLGVKIDTDRKNFMRNKIINQRSFDKEEQQAIMEYCASDIKYLKQLKDKMIKIYSSRLKDTSSLVEEIHLRGNYGARTALMEDLGYPVDVKGMEMLRDSVPLIMRDLAEDINTRFPIFKWNKKENRFSKDTNSIQMHFEEYLKEHKIKNYPRSDKTQRLSMDKNLLEDTFQFKHSYPEDDFIAQYMRFNNTESNIKSFRAKKEVDGKDNKFIFDRLGSDGRIRANFGIYGAQSARSQPPSSHYMMLKSSWLRSLVMPPKGRAICGIDYASQEFLISALVSGDKKMLQAYRSGDVYLAFGKAIGAIPKDGTKENYKALRNLFKATVLGLSYNMGYEALGAKLRRDLNDKTITNERAKELVKLFFSVYKDFAKWNDWNLARYETKGYIKLPCGWYMWGDNPNWRSVNNIPIQGLGSSILRKAVSIAQDNGVDIILTLHDALYSEFDLNLIKGKVDLSPVDKLHAAMVEGFIYYFEDKEAAKSIRLDTYIFSPQLKEGIFHTPNGVELESTKYYVPEKGAKEYEYFKKYIGR